MNSVDETSVLNLDFTQMDHIRELVRSHHPLAHGQLPSILASLEEKMTLADDEISKRRAELDDLVAQRGELRAQYDICGSLDAPVRRLPSEILVEIFALHSAAFCMREKYGVMDEFAFDRLAQAPLLTLSQVCARWHSIAIDTPSLWTDIFLSSQLWHTPSTTETAFNLLQSALERGKSYPLTVFLTNDDLPVPQSTLSLIAAHSQRWRAVTFDCHLSEIRRLMATDMPRVERIEFGYNIDMVESETEDLSTEISLKSAPHLRRLVFDATLCAHIVNLDRERLDVVRYRHLSSADIDTLVSLMSRLPTKQFQFQFFLDDYTRSPSHTITLGIPPTSSDIWDLSIGIDGEFHKQHCRQALSEILGSLTLPHLHTLAFRSTKYQRFPLLWPQPQFLALIARSSFHLNLRNLSLSHVQITEAQLLQFLPLLTALERLEIADHARVRSRERVGGNGVSLVLITDSLLHALTESLTAADNHGTDAEPALVPRLEYLRVRTRLQFSDAAYLAFVRARGQFTSEMFVMAEADRDWRSLHAQLRAQEGVTSIVWAA